MAKYRSGGGEYVKFVNVGDGVSGVVESVGSDANKFKGGVDTMIYVRTADGSVKTVRCDKKALAGAAAQIINEGGFRRGERIEIRFEGEYSSKFANKGKDITIDLPDRDGAAPPAALPEPAPMAHSTIDAQVTTAYDDLVKAKGIDMAQAVLTAAKSVAKGDAAKQVELLRKAAA